MILDGCHLKDSQLLRQKADARMVLTWTQENV